MDLEKNGIKIVFKVKNNHNFGLSWRDVNSRAL
jgi:hypothetical protein